MLTNHFLGLHKYNISTKISIMDVQLGGSKYGLLYPCLHYFT